MQDPIVIVGMARTPLGGFQGALQAISAPKLGAAAITAALSDAKVDGEAISEVLMGCVLPAGLGQAPARQAAIHAGLPQAVGASTVNKVCGSGMKTVMMASQALACGDGDLIVAGGMESMSNSPYLLPKARSGYRMGHGSVLDHMFLDGLEDAYQGKLMGVYAEACAKHFQFSREVQDEYALQSLQRALDAQAQGRFRREIVPLTVSDRKGELTVDVDEQPASARPDKIPQLKPAFDAQGTVTAANASSISDGAAALVLTRASYAEAAGLRPLARIAGFSQHAQAPEWFTTAPVGAMQKLLAQVGWSVADVDLFEINEAFAVVTLAAMQELEIPRDKVNIHGGACALGHPLGASGARILVTLLAALEAEGKQRGVASLCIGGGEATALAVERL